MTATATSNIATTTSATLCSEERSTNNSSVDKDSDSDRDTVSSQTRAEKREGVNFASQTVRLLREERGVQVETEEQEEEVASEERKAGERRELARLRVSLIEAKVASFNIPLSLSLALI